MQDQEPLTFEEIAEYFEQPDAAAHDQFRRRLLASPLSRKRADLAWRIQQTLREDPQCVAPEIGEEVSLTAALRGELLALRAGTLDAERGARLRSQLQADPRLLREALHYSVAEGTSPEARAPGRTPILNRVKQLTGWRVPVWAAAAAIVVLVLAVVLVAPLGVERDDGLRLAAYRDDPVIRFAAQDTLPGLGFFTDAQTETHPFADVDVRLSGSGLVMDWPEVAGAQGYTVQLLVMEQGRQQEIARLEVTSSSAVVDDLRPVSGQRYVWMISGTTVEQRRFATRGGFVLQ